MNRMTALLTLALLIVCGLMISPHGVTGQSGNSDVSPNGAVVDPCLAQPPPPQCTPAPTPEPRMGVSMGAIIRRDELEEQDQDIRGPNPTLYPNAKRNIE